MLYTILVETAPIPANTGTDANVFIALRRADGGYTEEQILDNAEDNFEAGKLDAFLVNFAGGHQGELIAIRIRHDNSGDKPGWLLDRVRVLDDNKVWNFPWFEWLARDEPPHSIVAEIPASPTLDRPAGAGQHIPPDR